MPTLHTMSGQTTASLLPGFDNPVDDAQQVFRATLQAISHPGRIETLSADCGVPDGLSPAMTALLLTLADPDTPVWLPADVAASIGGFLRFHCGCPLVDEVAAAQFVCVPAGHDVPALHRCAQGDPAFPDRSATLIVEVASLDAGDTLTLRGPGIETTCTLRVGGLPEDFRHQWQANHAGFPLGVDLLLTAGERICALPRTTLVED
ncbi:carbon-phosphorus lyase [Cupriavidus sp. HPC(L)]|uniref:phosphonate C-P lyase system protein PhnH n=1 Tax=Cupriavidus sp. HPC(L) TaxID=1217418 RepID=UPI000291BF2C|nr:phosphonate C-P lyase system protein PhnH [Cupriavidus sp. HPC(L)]ESH91857.1 carbon-phosphorus lyase [Cupriavidus sp. HPC(L)]